MQVKYRIEGMDCANCALTLERSLGQVEGVEQVQVSFSLATLEAEGNFEAQALVGRVQAMGYKALPYTEAAPSSTYASQKDEIEARWLPLRWARGVMDFVRYLWVSHQTRIALVGTALLLLSAPLGLLPGDVPSWIKTGLQIGVAVLAGYPIANKGLRALWVGRQITIDLLMSIATLGALLIGETGEASTVILLFAIGEALEGYTAEQSRNALRGLLALKPDQAHVLRPCMDCAEHMGQEGYTGGPCPWCGTHETAVPVGQVQVGERVVVRPGERIPVDGQVLSGASAVNQAPVTGESMPVNKVQGDDVYAGTLNGEGVLEVAVQRQAGDSTISRIVRLVEQAQAQRAPVERFIDRFAAWYTPAVVGLAFGLAILPPLLFHAPFYDLADGTHGWLYRSLALLIVACPCALVISTPVTMVSALSSLARRGVLVKGGAFLDMLARARVFAFDKTGTLTMGHPVVTRTRTLDCPPDAERCQACDEMLALAAAVERRSEHPLAQAIVMEAELRQLTHAYPKLGAGAEGVQALRGQGVQGYANGELILVGSHELFHERFDGCSEFHDEVQAAEAKGETVMLVSGPGSGERILGYISVADTLRASSRQALQEIKAIGPADKKHPADTKHPAIHTVMLTGDNLAVAQKIADQVGSIDEVRASLMPEDKLEAVRELQRRYGLVVMVGDGVNDTPALAAASVGVAVGGAGLASATNNISAQALETADVALMQADLTRLPETIRTSRRTRRIIAQNITFSLAIKAIFLMLTLPGWTTLWMAVFADMGASLLVTLNGMRMLRNGESTNQRGKEESANLRKCE